MNKNLTIIIWTVYRIFFASRKHLFGEAKLAVCGGLIVSLSLCTVNSITIYRSNNNERISLCFYYKSFCLLLETHRKKNRLYSALFYSKSLLKGKSKWFYNKKKRPILLEKALLRKKKP